MEPLQSEQEFKQKLEELMDQYDVTLKIAVRPVGKVSEFIHWATKRIFILDSAILIKSNVILQPDPNNK